MPPHTGASLPNPTPNPIPNPGIDDGADTHIINDAEVAENEEYSFNKIWDLYDKHVGRMWYALNNFRRWACPCHIFAVGAANIPAEYIR